MNKKVCPVVAAIREIKGAADYKTGGAAIIGGDEYCFDEIAFQLNIRKLALARLELSRPDLLTMRRFRAEYPYKTVEDVYNDVKKYLPDDRITAAVDALHDALDSLVAALIAEIRNHARVNVTIPPVPVSPAQMSDPTVIHDIVNKYIVFINTLNINVMLTQPVVVRLATFSPFLAQKPPITDKTGNVTPIIIADGTSPAEILDSAKLALAAEEPVYKYLSAIEQYYCSAIAALHEVTSTLVKITGLFHNNNRQ